MKQKTKKLSIWHYLGQNKLMIALYMLANILASAASIFQTLTFAQSLEFVVKGINESSVFFTKAIYATLVLLGFAVFKRICWYLSNIIYFKTSTKIMGNLNLDLAKQAFKLNSKTFSNHSTGTFVQRIIEDPERVVDDISEVFEMFVTFIEAVIMLVYIMTLNIYVALVFLAIAVICIVEEKIRLKFYRKHNLAVRAENDKIHSLTTEVVQSEKDIKSLGLEKPLTEVTKNNYERYKKSLLKKNIVSTSFWSVRNLLINICEIVVLILGIHFIDKGLLTLAAFMIIYSNNDRLYDVVWSIGNIGERITRIKVSTKRMFTLFDEEEFVTEKFGTISKDSIDGNIEFENVGYSYVEYESDDEDDDLNAKKGKRERKIASTNVVFESLSFKIEANTTVAFVGKSGSGKSTILNLISKMYEADKGFVKIDGININDFDKETLRRTIALVNQFPYIFDMTIKENLLLANPNASDADVFEAIDKASLKEFVESLPKGINTRVGERGIKLSGGQKQRLAIARALLRKSNILIFDESTSSLDNFAQGDIKKSIDDLKGTSTIIIVAHRLSTIRDVDKIFFLDEGKIVDSGTFDELFKRNKQFHAMFLAENI